MKTSAAVTRVNEIKDLIVNKLNDIGYSDIWMKTVNETVDDDYHLVYFDAYSTNEIEYIRRKNNRVSHVKKKHVFWLRVSNGKTSFSYGNELNNHNPFVNEAEFLTIIETALV